MGTQLLVTGFGPFLDVLDNPSRALAERLALRPPKGWSVEALPLEVSFEGVGRALDRWALTARRPDLLLGLGLHRGGDLRVERRARAELTSAKPDNGGRRAADLGELWAALSPPERTTDLDLGPLLAALHRRGAPGSYLSEDAGGFVCERSYYHLLALAERFHTHALFVHIPAADRLPLERQEELLGELLSAARLQLAPSRDARGARTPGPPSTSPTSPP